LVWSFQGIQRLHTAEAACALHSAGERRCSAVRGRRWGGRGSVSLRVDQILEASGCGDAHRCPLPARVVIDSRPAPDSATGSWLLEADPAAAAKDEYRAHQNQVNVQVLHDAHYSRIARTRCVAV
jgi:hypothetical protein